MVVVAIVAVVAVVVAAVGTEFVVAEYLSLMAEMCRVS